ncbi:MAG TPA: NAD-dependent epimerase/dehydratase family protein [Polyangiaceae bacterium]|nr:NAD-dependent epimerase/dehydratase family protein [Polyangiaceae bacterium]
MEQPKSGYTLITGGAGFIGTNLAHRLLSDGERVTIFDNFSRAGSLDNARWLSDVHGARLSVERGDCRDAYAVEAAVRNATSIFHLAAQVAVTTSLEQPLVDFESNARGTLNVLEAARRLERRAPLLFTSTNKVYGPLHDVSLEESDFRVEPGVAASCRAGIDESRPLDFHSPYGCSKGAADQYVLDYARTFDMPATVFRMSCIYGPHQHGNEDQGWVAHFLIRALAGESITVFGDGKQVRDILFVDDLVRAMLLARKRMQELSGTPFNIGGGPRNCISLRELLDRIGSLLGRKVEVHYEPARLADQRYYSSNHESFSRATGWKPAVGVDEGIDRLSTWLLARRQRAPQPVAAKYSSAFHDHTLDAPSGSGSHQ